MCKALALALLMLACALEAHAASQVLSPLDKELIQRGVPAAEAKRLLASPQVRFEGRLLANMLSRPESKLNYGQFLSKKTVKKAQSFARKHGQELARVQANTGVEPGVVVAILSVESRLGAYTGNWPVFNVLASQAVLDTAKGQKALAASWPKGRAKELKQPAMQKRLDRRAAWAKDELAALVKLAQREKRSPLAYKGSPAGALGMAQFMPTSILRWGADGDQDGHVDLHLPVDAVHSVARYLQKHGWKPGLSHDRQIKVILTYNHSTPYAETVLKLAEKIR